MTRMVSSHGVPSYLGCGDDTHGQQSWRAIIPRVWRWHAWSAVMACRHTWAGACKAAWGINLVCDFWWGDDPQTEMEEVHASAKGEVTFRLARHSGNWKGGLWDWSMWLDSVIGPCDWTLWLVHVIGLCDWSRVGQEKRRLKDWIVSTEMKLA